MLSKAASSIIFWVSSMSRPGIEPRSPGPLANTLLISPMARFISIKQPYNFVQIILSHNCLQIIAISYLNLIVYKLWALGINETI